MLYQKHQNRLIQEQDQHIQQINQIATRLKYKGKQINLQLSRQNKLISELDQQFDQTKGKLNFVQQKLVDLLQTNDMSQICTLGLLTLFMMIMITLIILF